MVNTQSLEPSIHSLDEYSKVDLAQPETGDEGQGFVKRRPNEQVVN